LVLKERDDVVGVLIGSTFGTTDTRYEASLRERAERIGKGRILMPGYFGPDEVQLSWPDFDCALHVPISENCGGVVEPLMAKVPTIASLTGGLPEIVIDEVTGICVPVRDPNAISSALFKVLNNREFYAQTATAGRQLVKCTFDVNRTGNEIVQIYRYLLEGAPRPDAFSPISTLEPCVGSDRGDTISFSGTRLGFSLVTQ